MSSIWVDLMGAEIKFYQGKIFRTRVAEAGQGEALFLLHGTGGHMEAWSRNVMRLSRDFRVLAMDMIWHGYTNHEPLSNDPIPAHCRHLLDLMDAANIEKIHIEGESVGGWVAMWMALHYPERVGKIILNTAAGVMFDDAEVKDDKDSGVNLLASRSMAAVNNPDHPTIRKRLEWLVASPDRITDELVEVRQKIYKTPAANKSLRHYFHMAFVEGRHYEYGITKENLAKITHPTLVLWTEHNPGTGPEVGKKIASLIPGSEYYCINDAGHWPQWEKPEEHDQIVADFLKK